MKLEHLVMAHAIGCLSIGCTGQIGQASGGAPQGGSSRVGHDPAAPGSSVGGAPPPGSPRELVPCEGTDYGSLALHRLSQEEYTNTVADLLGLMGNHAGDFPVDETFGGFRNVSEVLGISDNLVQRMVDKAAELASAATFTSSAHAPGLYRRCTTPATPAAVRQCAAESLGHFTLRAFRRPATSTELDSLVALVEGAVAAGDTFDFGMRLAAEAVLASPSFFFRSEAASASVAGIRALTSYEVASRLSYFLWRTMPDRTLLDLAARDALRTPTAVSEQVNRMMADARFLRFVDGLSRDWLTHRLSDFAPDAGRYPEWATSGLGARFEAETRMFFRHVVENDLPVETLLDADFSFLDATLARHYGVAASRGSTLEKASLPAAQRTGVLTHGAVLSQTSGGTRASPIKRGLWVLERMICSPPPPPPNDVNTDLTRVMPPEGRTGPLSIRERLALHLGPQCQGCHSVMDPVGLGLENFDTVGAWQTKDENGLPVIPDGNIYGKEFSTPRELANVLKQSPDFKPCVVRMAFIAGRGRALRYDGSTRTPQTCEAKRIAANMRDPRSNNFRAIVRAMVAEDNFLRSEVISP